MDRTFWSETLDPGNARQNPVLAIGIQSDGSIVLGGTAIRCSGAEEPNALFRLKSDGTYDPNFNFHESMVEQYQVRSLLILQDDRIVACVKDKFGWHKPSLRVFGQNGEPMGTFGDYPLNAEVDAMLPLEGTGIYLVASVVRQADCILTSFSRPRLTFSRMSVAVAVQTNGLGSLL